MHIPGHLALAWWITRGKQGRLTREVYTRAALAPALLGALLPDLIDKPILYLGLSLYGRTVGHSLLTFWLVCAVALLIGRRAGGEKSLALGFLAAGMGSHLLLDLFEGVIHGLLHGPYVLTHWWIWPYLTPDVFSLRPPGAILFPGGHQIILLEVGFVLITAITAILFSSPRTRRGEDRE